MLRQINRTVSIQWILRDQITSAALNECARYKFDVSAQYGCTNRATIARAHSKNIKVALWLFTDSRIADCYKNWGTDYLTCERMLQIPVEELKQYGNRNIRKIAYYRRSAR